MKIAAALAVLAGLAMAQDPQPVPTPAPKPAPAPEGQQKPEKQKQLQLGARLDGETALMDIDGKNHKAAACMGKITVVNFYSIQCPIMAAWDPALAAIQREYSGKGIVFLGIDSNVSEIGREPPKVEADTKPYENVRSHLAKKDLPYTVLVDHGNVIADFFGASATPHAFVFGADGRLVYRGLIDDDQHGKKGADAKRYLKDTLDQLLAGKTVTPFKTEPVGCSIKKVNAGGRPQQGRGNGGG